MKHLLLASALMMAIPGLAQADNPGKHGREMARDHRHAERDYDKDRRKAEREYFKDRRKAERENTSATLHVPSVDGRAASTCRGATWPIPTTCATTAPTAWRRHRRAIPGCVRTRATTSTTWCSWPRA